MQFVGMRRLIIVGCMGGLLGLFVAASWNPLPLGSRTKIIPAAYRVPKIPGGTPLRMAMVHDILHERYLRHGTAWHVRRMEFSRTSIEQTTEEQPSTRPSPEWLGTLDDMGVDLESVGQYDQAIMILREKLAFVSPLPPFVKKVSAGPASKKSSTSDDQPEVDKNDLERILSTHHLTMDRHHQYTTCANLGTVLVHSAMTKALAGDVFARQTVAEGLDFIERAIAINPGAHFGRERWQAIAIEHLLACIDHPDLLTSYDFLGDPLGPAQWQGSSSEYTPRKPDDTPLNNLTQADRLKIRSRLTRIGYSEGWADIVHPDYDVAMPFDEPTLAIIGMWTLGGGPNPHFSLALATIMEVIGQREIAWNAYERTLELSDKFWPDPAIREKLRTHCRERQRLLAQREAVGNEKAWEAQMRAQHQKELAWGLNYQKQYQEYEAATISKGVTLEDPHFYDSFFAAHPSVASATGLADDMLITTKQASFVDSLPCIAIGAGITMCLALFNSPKRQKSH